jgi:hypothetical protein
LHALSTPQAFILDQDQILLEKDLEQLKSCLYCFHIHSYMFPYTPYMFPYKKYHLLKHRKGSSRGGTSISQSPCISAACTHEFLHYHYRLFVLYDLHRPRQPPHQTRTYCMSLSLLATSPRYGVGANPPRKNEKPAI